MAEILKIIQEEPDPHGVNRISMGGLQGVGFYVVLRGEMKDNIKIIKRCLEALEASQAAVKTAQGDK
jgi:hypothetical protein